MINNVLKNFCLIIFALIAPITLPAGGIQKSLNQNKFPNNTNEITIFLSDQNEMKLYLLNHAAYMRLLLMGLVLILALRFFPKGIIEEEKRL